jgi:hypothetical protein
MADASESTTPDAEATETAAPAKAVPARKAAKRAPARKKAGEDLSEVSVAEVEQLLVDDSAPGQDLKVKVSEAWHEFARALAGAIPKLPQGTHVDLTLDPTASGTGKAIYEVSLQRHDDGKVGALAVSNAGLPEGQRLDRTAVAEMVVLGWAPPGVVAGSEKDFGIVTDVRESARLAVTVTKTLRDIYGAPHPAFLTYAAHDEQEAAVAIPALGSARIASADDRMDGLRLSEEGFAALEDPNMPLAERVAIVVAGVQRTTPESLQVDSDGDIGIRAGSAMVFVRVRDNPPLIDVFSPILTELEASEKLYVKLSELTTKMPIGRLYFVNKTVWASVPVLGRDFQPTHLMLALQVMTGLADELDDRLHGEFGGRRFFVESDAAEQPKAAPDSDAGIGMYL